MHYSGEAKHFWVHFQGGDGARGDDYGGEAVEDGFDGDGRVEAGKVEDWVGDCGGVGFVRLENEEEAFVVCSSESSEGSYFLERLVVLNVRELKSSD